METNYNRSNKMKKNSHAANEMLRIGRRTFLRIGALGGGASLLSLVLPGGMTQAAGKTEALLLSCMDYRLLDEIERYMSVQELRDKYDHVILAGASLGAVTDKYPAWNQTFWAHLDLAVRLHQVHKVIALDHRDCGAYQLILGEDFYKNRAKETAIHTENLKELRKEIHEKYPKLEVELLLMDTDGKIEEIK
jgi:carbonic anhydrase